MSRELRWRPQEWIGPWRLYVLDRECCEWRRAFRVHGGTGTRLGPIVRNRTGLRWGWPGSGVVPPGTKRTMDEADRG